jgi:MFS family permease
MLGASPSIVGLVAGIGEFVGYALRLASGYIVDRAKAYWLLTFIGYGLLLSIPLLAFAGYWQLAAVLIILERMGKAIRSPARDTMLSYATKEVGRGWGFAVHEALDQIGAVMGPIIFSLVLLFHGSYLGSYREGFTLLWIPALLTLVVLAIARRKFPSPQKLEAADEASKQGDKGKLPRVFWFYTIFTLFSVAGFANFQLISYHSIVPDAQIPIMYAIAMGVDALAALLVGKTYDKIGLISLLAVPLLTLPIPFLAFSHSYSLVLMGIILWGVVMGIQETIMRAAIADLTPIERRGFAYGVFNTAYGAGWFLGGALMGLLYELSINYLILFAVVMELISIPLFFLVRRAA